MTVSLFKSKCGSVRYPNLNIAGDIFKLLRKTGVFIFILFLAFNGGPARAQGTWANLTHSAPHSNGGVMLVMTDGRIFCKTNAGGSGQGTLWDILTPDSHGSYQNGTWTTSAAMANDRLYFSSQVLRDGRIYVAGGEYGAGGSHAEIYNPQTNTWSTATTSSGTPNLSDCNSELLPDGTVLEAIQSGTTTANYIYNAAANSVSATGSCFGSHDEAAWVKLPDNSILQVDIFSTNTERYIPSTGTWIHDAACPVQLYDAFGLEAGGALQLPNGKIFFIGSTGHNAIYTPSGSTANGSWVAAPDFPLINGVGQGTPDAPAAMMVNGKVLCAVSPLPRSSNHFPDSTSFFEYDYSANSFNLVNTPFGGTIMSGWPTFISNMVNLPDGNVLYSYQGGGYYVYTPSGSAVSSGKPTVSSILRVNCDSFTAIGTLFNGISEGQSYGDDWQNASNYPIVRLTSGANVYYARVYNWNSTGISRGAAADTAQFILPAGLPGGTYNLEVVANGIASTSVSFNAALTISPSGPSVCSGAAVTLSDAWTGGAWSSSSTSVASVGSSTGIVTGGLSGTATITYTFSTGCTSSVVVTVNAAPSAITGTVSVCTGATTALSATPAGGTWTSNNVAIASVGSSTGVVTGVASGTTAITYTLPSGCFATTPLTVSSISPITGTASVCVGLTTSLSDATTGGAWSSAAPGIASVGSSSGVVTGVASGTAIITYLVSSGCFATQQVTVNANPAAITGTMTICTGGNSTLSSSTSGGSWTSSNPAIASVGALSGTVTGVTAGAADITYTLGTGCFAVATVTVSTGPSAITGTTNVCVGATTSLSDAAGGGTWSSSNTSVATIGSTSGIVTGIGSGVAIISYSIGGGCAATTAVTVNSTAAYIGGTSAVCVGLSTTLSAIPPGGTWSSGATSIATVGSSSGVVTGVAAGTVVITYLPTALGCFVTKTVTVNSSAGSITGTGTVCAGSTTTLSDASAGGTWSSGTPSVATVGSATGIVTGVSPGTSLITYSIGAGCAATLTVTVSSTAAYIGGASSVCIGLTATLSGIPSGGTWSSSAPSIATVGSSSGVVTGVASGIVNIMYLPTPLGCFVTKTMTVNSTAGAITGTPGVCPGSTTTLVGPVPGGAWSSSSISRATIGSSTGIVYGVTPGTSLITYSIGSGCNSTITVSVNPAPSVIPVSGGGSMCAGGPGINVGLPASAAGINYQLLSGGVSVGSPVAGTGSSLTFGPQTTSGVYTVTGTDTLTHCQSAMSGSATITVYALPTISAGSSVSICIGSSATLTASGGYSYIWSPSTGLSSTVGSTVFASPATTTTYTVTGTNTYGCSNKATVTVTVNPLPTISAGSGVSICSGASTTLTASGGVTYSWSPATGLSATTGASVTASPSATTTYTVTGANGFGCTSRATVTVTVNPLPTISASSSVSICNGASAALTASGGVSYTWSPATGLSASTGASVSARPSSTATYTVTGANSYGCTSNATVTVTVNPLPTISAGPGVAICNGASATLTASGGVTYSWSPATGLSSTTAASVIANPATTTTYTVTGSNSYGCSNAATVTVTVNSLPTISAGSNVSICNGASATLTASGGVTYTWSPATGLSSTTGASVTASPTTTITYTVTGASSFGCTSRAAVTVSVNPVPTISTSPSISICNGAAATLTASGGVTYTWSPGTGLSATTGSGVTATPASTTTYTVTGANSYGCTNKAMVTVTVNPVPSISAGSGTSVCGGGSAILTASGGVTYTWSPAAGLSATTGSSVSASPTTTTTYTVTGTNSFGCINRATVTITVNPSPASISSIGNVCLGTVATLTDATSGGTWSSSNISIATIGSASGVVSGAAIGSTTISYTLTSGCTTTLTLSIVPAASAIAGPTAIYTGSTVTYTNLTGGGAWSSSNTGIVTIGSASGLATGVAGGTDTISYIISVGCRSTLPVTVSATPVIDTVTGGGVYCTGGAAPTIGLSNSQIGVNYQLYLGASAVGSAVAGTGSAISFGTFTVAGTYTAVAFVTGYSTISMAGSATVTVVPSTMLPAPVAVGGGGAFCAGSPGVAVNLPGSAVTVNYQLYRNGVMTGGPVAGVGTALSFGLQTLPGLYTVIGTSTINGCARAMTGSANVTVYPAPSVYSVTGGGSYCSGGAGIIVGLGNSQIGINYQLHNGSLTVGSPVAGIGSAISFGYVTAGGAYTVTGTNASTACASSMTGTATVTVNPLPVISGSTFLVAPASTITLSGTPSGGTWTSSTPSVATIGSSSGVITGVNIGSTLISYSAAGCSASHTVYVTATGHRQGSNGYGLAGTDNIVVAPNPNHGTFNVRGTFASGEDEEATLEVTNTLGQVIYTNKAMALKGELDQVVQLSGALANGMYLLHVRSASGHSVFHIVVEQ